MFLLCLFWGVLESINSWGQVLRRGRVEMWLTRVELPRFWKSYLTSSDPRPDTLFWHSFWHIIWKCIIYIYIYINVCIYTVYMYRHIYIYVYIYIYYICSNILSDILFCIFSGFDSGLLSGMSSGPGGSRWHQAAVGSEEEAKEVGKGSRQRK